LRNDVAAVVAETNTPKLLRPVPAAEVSGLDAAATGDGIRLLAVADERVAVYLSWVELSDGDVRLGAWQTIDLSRVYPPPKQGSNFEGVAADAQDLVVVLAEHPASLLSFPLHEPSRLAKAEIDLESVAGIIGHEFDRDEFQFLGEGLVLLDRGHVLVAREREPMGLLELAPHGEPPLGLHGDVVLSASRGFAGTSSQRYDAVGWWTVDDELDDISDITVHEGWLYLLSDRSRRIARVALDGQGSGERLRLDAVWRLASPGKGGKPKNPEGLAFPGGGVALVAYDQAEGKENLAMIPGFVP
jgi:uncharacterized protein YjiK